MKQPRNRIGWLWLVIGLTFAFSSLSQGLKYHANSTSPVHYSSLLFTMLLFSETTYIIRFICYMLMMLWFPDGKPPAPRWRLLHGWAVVSFISLILDLFAQKVPWSNLNGIGGDAPLVDNPIGFLPTALNIYAVLSAIGFLSIVGMSLIAVLAMWLRYRSAGQQVRTQIKWFVVGGAIYAAGFLASIVLLDYSTFLPGILYNVSILPLYLAVGIAITRYQLYDIDIIIRKTLQYALVTALLALVYFGGVTLLQRLFTSLSGQQSPVAVVLSTLLIAALFNPLRRRIQDFIDRNFYRQKYDAERALAEFAAAASRETELQTLAACVVGVIEQTMQPEKITFWLNEK